MMERYKWILGFILIPVLLGLGFLFGATYANREMDDGYFFALIAQLKREDSMLGMLKKREFERATEFQEKYLLATISQLQLSGRRLPADTTRLISEYKDRKPQESR